MASQRFTKAHRVRRRGEFQRVFDLSLRVKGRYLTVLMAPNAAGVGRLGIVASRKLGDAVRRNRAKRLIREIFRLTPPVHIRQGVDVVVIPRRELFDAGYPSLESDFRGALTRCAARLPVPADAAR
ncbi:MAG: ribonuclease P protein component [Acidobacteriota bacterium]